MSTKGFKDLQLTFQPFSIVLYPKFPPLAGNSKFNTMSTPAEPSVTQFCGSGRNEMEYCVRLHCKPVKVKHCIQNAPEVETKRICTPTLSLSCLKGRQRRCQLEVGALGAENRAEFNQCMRRPSVGVL